mmetsp:Transcript_10551/g.33731  ORF Transcript_10551/g.33731 Transcript_10551/m.33731 type:complete len:225 (+) Transcript_10551:20-694(+)
MIGRRVRAVLRGAGGPEAARAASGPRERGVISRTPLGSGFDEELGEAPPGHAVLLTREVLQAGADVSSGDGVRVDGRELVEEESDGVAIREVVWRDGASRAHGGPKRELTEAVVELGVRDGLVLRLEERGPRRFVPSAVDELALAIETNPFWPPRVHLVEDARVVAVVAATVAAVPHLGSARTGDVEEEFLVSESSEDFRCLALDCCREGRSGAQRDRGDDDAA